MTITVVNKKAHRGVGIYIGRPSPLGNPFVIGRDGDREAVILKYESWLIGRMNLGDQRIWNALADIKEAHEHGHEVNLICWCAPQACHGDVIKRLVLAHGVIERRPQ